MVANLHLMPIQSKQQTRKDMEGLKHYTYLTNFQYCLDQGLGLQDMDWSQFHRGIHWMLGMVVYLLVIL